MTIKPITEDELLLVKEAILFPYILSTLEHDIKLINESELKMKELYVTLFRKAQDNVSAALSLIRKNMRNNGIKLIEEKREKDRATTSYLCRGYQHEYVMVFSHIKTEVAARLEKHLQINMED